MVIQSYYREWFSVTDLDNCENIKISIQIFNLVEDIKILAKVIKNLKLCTVC